MMTGLFRRRSVGQLLNYDVHCLDGTVFSPQLSKKATGQELLMLVFRNLKIQDASALGLVFAGDNAQQEWLNPTRPVRKQIPGDGPFQLFLQVRVYPQSPQDIKDVQTRYQVFLQVKKDVLQGRLRCSQQHLVDFLALLVQAELGDYSSQTFPDDYLDRSGLVDPQSLHKMQIMKAHQEMRGMSFDECEIQVLELAQCQENYGVVLYPVLDSDKTPINLGLGPSGVHVVMGTVPVAVYEWSSVLKVTQKYHTISLKIRTPHTMAIHTVKFYCPSNAISKQLALLCHEMQGAYQLSTPYSNTFRRMWSGRRSDVLKSPFQKLRSSIKRRSSSSDISMTRKISRHFSFQDSENVNPRGGVPAIKRSISENFSDRKLPDIEYNSPPDPVLAPVRQRYQETGQPVISTSPYSTPKQSVVAEEDVKAAVGERRYSKKTKAISDSSLNNILDSSGKSIRNIQDKSLADLSDTSEQLSIVTENSQLGTPVAFRPPSRPRITEHLISSETVATTPNVPANTSLSSSVTATTKTTTTNISKSRGVSVPSIVVKAMSERVQDGRPVSRQSDVGLYHFNDSSEQSTPEPVLLRDKNTRASHQRHSHLWDTEDNMDQTPFLDSHIASMYFETSQQDELTCDL